MSSIFGLLHTGASGMKAQGYGLQITGQNAQNVNTEGYTRKDVKLSALPVPPFAGGVSADGSTRIRDSLLEQRLLGAKSNQGAAEAKLRSLKVLDRVLADSESGLGQSLDEFETVLVRWSSNPEESALRQSVLQSAERLTTAFNIAGTEINYAQDDLDRRIEQYVDEVNQKLETIAELGKKIQRDEIGGQQAGDLRDQRDQLIKEVSEHIPLKVVEDSAGASVLLDGSLALVTKNGDFAQLVATRDPVTGDMSVMRQSGALTQDVSAHLDTGTLGGLIEARNGGLVAAETALDQLAFDITTSYNAVHSTGRGLDDVTGRNLFEPIAAAAGAAVLFSVSSDVADQPDRLAAGQGATLLTGDNRNILALADLAESDIASASSETVQEALARIIGDGGHAVRSAKIEVDFTTASFDQLHNLRESISGVSTDEEMINLSRYQRGYQASMRVVKTADRILEELIAMR